MSKITSSDSNNSNAAVGIDRGRPIPPHGGGVGRYPYRDMAVGDSLFVAGKPKHLYGKLTQWRKATGHSYTTRIERDADGQPTGIRVWRVEAGGGVPAAKASKPAKTPKLPKTKVPKAAAAKPVGKKRGRKPKLDWAVTAPPEDYVGTSD